jgi:DNA-directed RNA polymerase specialized sigma subunit
MEYYGFAIQRLKDYEMRKQSLLNIPEQIKTLEMQFLSIKSGEIDGMPKGSGSKSDDMLIYNIAKRDELAFNLAIAEREVELTERGLDALTDEEKTVLEYFYIQRPYNHISKLMDKLHVSQAGVFRAKDVALKKFTMSLYGIREL